MYNAEEYLKACIDSILAQTFTDFELILIDDGSPDNCGKICDEYAVKDSRIRVFHQENQGQAAARNNGVDFAKSDWICFVDSDDIVHYKMLELLYDSAIQHSVDLCLASLVSSNDVDPEKLNLLSVDTVSVVLQADENTFLQLFEDSRYHSVCSKLIKKHLLKKFPFENGRIHEDSPVICKWMYEARDLAFSPNILYVFNENIKSTTRRKFNLKKLDMMWAWEQQERFFDELNYNSMKRAVEIRHLYTASIIYSQMRKNGSGFRKQAVAFRRKILKEYRQTFKYPEFLKKDKLFAMENFFPLPMTIYWIIFNRFCRRK